MNDEKHSPAQFVMVWFANFCAILPVPVNDETAPVLRRLHRNPNGPYHCSRQSDEEVLLHHAERAMS